MADTGNVYYATYVQNLPYNLLAGLAWFALNYVIKFLCAFVCPGYIAKLRANKKGNDESYFYGIVVATVHAAGVCAVIIPQLLNPDQEHVEDPIFGSNDFSKLLFHVSCGYFYFDLYMCITENWGFAYTFHGVACSLVFMSVQYPFLHWYGMVFLLYELSTPLLHARWVLIKGGYTKGLLYPIVQYGFAAAFFVARIAVGWTVSATMLWPDVLNYLSSGNVHSFPITYLILFANLSLNTLNGYWFWNIMLVALGLDAKSRKRKAAAKKA